MVAVGFVVKDWFNRGLTRGRVSVLPMTKENDSDARVSYVPCTRSTLETARRTTLQRH